MKNLLDHFRKIPKIESHNHLNLGMQYEKYAKWAGFRIPNFPRKLAGLGEMHQIIGEYTRPRCATQQDIEDLLHLSIQDALEDGIAILEGSIDIGFIRNCNYNPEQFLEMVSKIVKKYQDTIVFKPELGLGKTFDKELIQKWAPICIKSGIFKSIDLYGPEVEEGLDDFIPIFDLANKEGLKTKAHVGEFSDAQSVKTFIDTFNLKEVQHGVGIYDNEAIMQYILDKNIVLNITPESNIMLGRFASLKEHPMRKFFDKGIKFTINTDDLLFFNKTISEQCVDLVNEGIFTIEEIEKIVRI
ncbi:MAG: adenosine deaminase [Spirochaetaceae bacterium]|nr:adenosine deaminase [Spirochaetaceae bacterium]